MSISPNSQPTPTSAQRPFNLPTGQQTSFDPVNSHVEDAAQPAIRGLQTPSINPHSLQDHEISKQTGPEVHKIVKLLEGRPIYYMIRGRFRDGFAEAVNNLVRLVPGLSGKLSVYELEIMGPEQIKTLKLGELSPRFIKALSPIQVKALTEGQIGALTPKQLNTLSPIQIKALSPIQVKALTKDQIGTLILKQLNTLSPIQMNALTKDQIGALTPKQLRALTAEQLGLLAKKGLGDLPLEKLRGVKEGPLKRVEYLSRLMGRNPNDQQGIYNTDYRINLNRANLYHYVVSKDFERHKQSVKVYHGSDLDTSKAQRIATQREPVNISGIRFYNEELLEKLMGYTQSAFQEDVETPGAKVACIYSQTFLWNPPGSKEKVEVGVLSVPAPALDDIQQPQFENYVLDIVDRHEPLRSYYLDGEKYKNHMSTIAKAVVSAAVDNKKNTKRLVIPLYGHQANFLRMINGLGKDLASEIFQETLTEALLERADELKGIEVVISEFGSDNGKQAAEAINKALEQKESKLKVGSISGDIKETALAGDLIVNAWNPHSAPGNGNEGHRSLDAQMGRSTGILATQTNWFNTELNNFKRYKLIK